MAAILEQSMILPWRFRMFTEPEVCMLVLWWLSIIYDDSEEQSIILPWWFRMSTDLKCAILEQSIMAAMIQNWPEVCIVL